MNKVEKIYERLLIFHGSQGWWPVLNIKTGLSVYSGPAGINDRIRFEICIGAILTQNVAWKNVEKSLAMLKGAGLLAPRSLYSADQAQVAGLIRSSGYYNQKAMKIKSFLEWFRGHGFSFKKLEAMETPVLRDGLLSVKGVGPETADSILLYAMQRKIFVVDAYTKRIFSRLGLAGEDWTYGQVQDFFQKKFHGGVGEYNEYHALIVAHGKDICKNSPACLECCLARMCPSMTLPDHDS